MRRRDLGLARAISAHATESVPATYRDGTLLGYVGAPTRRAARLADVDEKVIALLVALEDRRFWSHHGLDFFAICRALLVDAKAMGPIQGGSTLTQQLLKNTLLLKWSGVGRKILELPLAPISELLLGKPWILESYLNAVYFGGGLYGLRTASLGFLGKEPRGLSWAQAAVLAGLPAGPEGFAFYRPNPLARPRRDFVLRRAHRLGLLSANDLVSALEEPMPQSRFPHSATRDLLAHVEVRGGSQLMHTTLDRSTHLAASRIARKAAGNGYCAIASVDIRTGEIRALATRWSSAMSGFDVALTSSMSPGSAVKPFVLAAALDAGYGLDQVFPSGVVHLQVEGKSWQVENWRGQSYGPSTLAQATLNSDNTVYARLIVQLGHWKAAEVITAAGLPAWPSPGPALTLGVLNAGVSPAQVAASFGTLAGLDFFPAHLDADVQVPSSPQVVSKTARSKVQSVLRELVRAQVSSRLASAGAFGKTGTPDDGLTGWFVGVHEDLATTVVVSGGPAEAPTKARLAAEAWAAFYEELRRVRSRGR